MRVVIAATAAGYILVVAGFYAAWHPLGSIAAGAMLLWAATHKKAQ